MKGSGGSRCPLRHRCDAADACLSSECFYWGGFELSCYHPQAFALATPHLLDVGRGGSRLPCRSRVGYEAKLQSFVNFHQLVLFPPPLLRGEGGEHSASCNRLCRYVLDVRAEGLQPVQCDFEEFRLRVVKKPGAIGTDCGLPVRVMGVCGEECHFTCVGVEDHFLGCAPVGDDGDRTL